MEKANFGRELKATYECARRNLDLSQVDQMVSYILLRLKDYAENGREEAIFDGHQGSPTALLTDSYIRKRVASELRAYGLNVLEETSVIRIKIKG